MQDTRTGSLPAPEALTDAPTLAAAAARAVALARAGESRKGLALALLARQRARDLDIGRAEADALNAAGVVHAMRGDHIAAVAAGIDAWEVAHRCGARSAMGHAMVTLSQSAFAIGALPGAHAAIAGCVEQAERDRDPGLEIRARNALGIVLGDAGEFDAAQRELARALILVHDHRAATCPSRITANLANLRCKRARRLAGTGRDGEARTECLRARRLAVSARDVATQEPNVPVEIDALAIQGRAANLAGDHRDAIGHLAAACRVAAAARVRTPLPWILCERAGIHLALGEGDVAHALYLEALEIAQDLRPSAKVEAACEGLARVERARDNDVGHRRWSERAAAEARDFERSRLQARRQLESFFAG